MRQQCTRYTLIVQDLYTRAYSKPLLKCVTKEQEKYVLEEINEGVCGSHSGARTMAAKMLGDGYFWPTVPSDYIEYVKKCAKCQKHDPLSHLKCEALHNIVSPWSFAIWGWTSLVPSFQEKGIPKYSWSKWTTSPSESRSSPSPPSRPRMFKTSYGGVQYADLEYHI